LVHGRYGTLNSSVPGVDWLYDSRLAGAAPKGRGAKGARARSRAKVLKVLKMITFRVMST
jgi:hypothetical protein